MKTKIFFTAIIVFALLSSMRPASFWRHAFKSDTQDTTIVKLDSTVLAAKTIAANLDVPWEIIWGPDNWIWMTQQRGIVSKVNPETGQSKILLHIPDVYKKKSYGLLGFAIHPNFKNYPYVYLDYTYLKPAALTDTTLRDSSILSKLVRYTYKNDSLINPRTIISDIPGNTYHNGCRVIISPDMKIFLTTGDSGHPGFAQMPGHLNGKILRLNLDGSIPGDNPFKGSPVWTIGHRNAEGLAFAPNGILYSSENGDASDDEINIIVKGRNYGWPNVEGFCNLPKEKAFCSVNNITEPLIAWTPTIAPSGIEYYNSNAIPEWKNSIIIGTLKGNSLHILKLNPSGTSIVSDKIFFDHQFGRIRDVCISPNGDVYLSTSNRDWNPAPGFPKPGDDKLIKIYKKATLNKTQLELSKRASAKLLTANVAMPKGAALYTNYCAACHKPNGAGLQKTFPPLAASTIVSGNKSKLIKLVLNGMTGPLSVNGQTYNQEMPSFKFMSDNDLASVLTYIRSNFSNHASAVRAYEIARNRVSK